MLNMDSNADEDDGQDWKEKGERMQMELVIILRKPQEEGDDDEAYSFLLTEETSGRGNGDDREKW